MVLLPRARAFPLRLGGAGREGAGMLVHSWVAQEDRQEGVTGTKLALVKTKFINHGRRWCVGALVVLLHTCSARLCCSQREASMLVCHWKMSLALTLVLH